MAVLTGRASELGLVWIVLLVARFALGLSDLELRGFLAFFGTLVALYAGRRHVCPLELELSVAIVTPDVVEPRYPARFVVTVVAGDAARRCLERVPVIIEMTGGANIGDRMRIGEVSSRRSDRDAKEPLARVPLDVTDTAFHLVMLAD